MIRAPMLIAKVLVLLAVAGIALSVAPGREARAQSGDLTGVYCIDLYTDGESPITPKGDPHQTDDGIQPNDEPETKIMTRIDPAGGSNWDLTQVSYRGPGGFSVTDPPTDDPCATKGDGNTLNVPTQPINVIARPTVVATVSIKSSEKALQWDICSFESDLSLWVNTHWNVVVQSGPPYYGILLVDVGASSSICSGTATGTAQRLVIEMFERDLNAGAPSGGLDDDWDGDGVTDWNELADPPPTGFCDPFAPPPCDVVGGVAGLPEVTSAPAGAADGEGGVNPLVAAAIAIAAGAAGIVAGAWYLRRRRAER